jgi:hypothetical protein
MDNGQIAERSGVCKNDWKVGGSMSLRDEMVIEEDVMFEVTVIIGDKRISRRYALIDAVMSRNARDFHWAQMNSLQEEWELYKKQQAINKCEEL